MMNFEDYDVKDLKAAYKWGKESIKALKENGDTIPTSVYERLIELADEIIATQDKTNK